VVQLGGGEGGGGAPLQRGAGFADRVARGAVPDFSARRSPAWAEDGFDMCYVRDCARAIALLQVAPRLSYRTYNVASGRVLTNREVATAVRRIVPSARVELPEGRSPAGSGQGICLDIGRLRQDTGYQPAYDTQTAVADYIAWLRAGHQR
jgi:UDP-glucose 4-epimerase